MDLPKSFQNIFKYPGRKNIFLLLIIWMAAIITVNPIGNFPLNDDWAYGQNVQTLVEEGRLHFNDWLVMTLVAQVLWGGLFCFIFGFSFTILRISTLVLAFGGIWACYHCFYELSRKHQLSFWATLLILFNPLFFSLSFSFMTDVPFFSTFMLSTLFFFRAIKDNRIKDIALGSFFAIFCTLIRQPGLLIPLVFGIVYFFKNLNFSSLIKAGLPLVLTFLVMMVFIEWLDASQGVIDNYGRPSLLMDRLLNSNLWYNMRGRTGIFLFYWGLFLLPLSLLLLPYQKKLKSKGSILGIILVGLLIFFAAKPVWPYIPSGNIFYNLGLGPKLLQDGHNGLNLNPSLSITTWNIIKAFGFFGAWLLIWMVWNQVLNFLTNLKAWDPIQWIQIGSGLVILIFSGYLYIDYLSWDRYYLLLIPFWGFLIMPANIPSLKRKTLIPYLLIFIFLAGFSIAATHDYLAWNRARWAAINKLTIEKNISPNRIDGGFEFNAFNNTGPRHPLSRMGRSWWFVGEDEYLISFGEVSCYEKIDSIPFSSYLPPREDHIYILQSPIYSVIDSFFCDSESLTEDKLAFVHSSDLFRFENGDRQDSTYAFSGKYSSKLNVEFPYGFTFRLRDVEPCERIFVSFWRYAESGDSKAGISFSSPEGSFFSDFQNEPVQKLEKGWELFHHEVYIPETYFGKEVLIFVWNPPPSEETWVDDIKVIRRR